jgi:predicted 3-demethylubiquinone-9 3-methyltransferase (glyoxalase superfamily)
MQKITPFLWFENIAEEAVNFYTSIFKNSKIDVAALEEAYNK